MTSGKWIPDITAETRTVDAARRALSLRLEALRDQLGAALGEVDKNLENIHQLRVACRRATAAVQGFRVCLPKKVVRAAGKQLRRLRRVAGDARDWDVLMLDLADQAKAASAECLPGLDLLFGFAMAHRIPAQERLEAVCPGYPFEFERWMSDTVAAVREPEPALATTGALGRQYLGATMERFWEFVRRPALSWEELHDLRLIVKQLRYAIELFAEAFPQSLQDFVYPSLVALQSILGDAHDGFVAGGRMEVLQQRLPELFARLAPRWCPLVEQVLKESRCQMQKAREQWELWKLDAERGHLEAVTRSILVGELPPVSASAYPVVQAS